MEEVPVIETEWGSELHRRLIAEKARLRMEWRESPGALEDVRQMAIAPPLQWDGIAVPAKSTRKTPIYLWTR
ncbi:MAG: hypothetical protein ABIS50_15970 [Luteolibacter sp.]|uniref:hypothetical protein n=1 Tax=Luteolibacter sp. TaxID=1962973 RepID=UPI0032665246